MNKRITLKVGPQLPLFDRFKRKKSNILPENKNQGNEKVEEVPKKFSDSEEINDRINQNNFSQFVEKALNSPADCKIRISQISKRLDQLTQGLESKGTSSLEIVHMINEKLLGVCPKCGTQTLGQELQGLHVLRILPTITTNIYYEGLTGGFERLLEGYCRNEKCACRDMLIFWTR